MDSTRWQKIKELFAAAIELPEDGRAVFLANIADAGLRGEVEKLLTAHEKATEFIDTPALQQLGLAGNDFEEDLAGKQIDGYEIAEKVGAGGMGAIYRATRAGADFTQQVAIKLIKRGMDTNAVLKRFITERQILATLEHPNIARLIDGGATKNGVPYFVMEYIAGGEPIRTFCDLHRLDVRERLELFSRVCSAVSYAHQKLVVHRDIKPSNILVTETGEPKLLDFGIAKLLSPDWHADTDEATATNFRLMTPEYASPEQLSGRPTSTSTDVYSLGIVLYELLTGTRPFSFKNKTPMQMAETVLTQEPVLPSSAVSRGHRTSKDDANSEDKTSAGNGRQTGKENSLGTNILSARSLRGDLDNIILKAIRKEPERRYQSVQEFNDDIRRYLDGRPVKATADSSLYRIHKFVKRHRIGVAMAAIVTVLLLAATGITSWQYAVASRERARAEQRFGDVRKLANSLLFELHDSIKDLPGATASRELIVSRALEYLDTLAKEAGQDRMLQAELAEAYVRVGDIQGGLHVANTGQRDKAKESYQKALGIREKLVAAEPGNNDFQLGLATSYRKMADMAWINLDIESAREMYGKAMEVDRALSSKLPDNTGVRSDLAMNQARYGRMRAAAGSAEEGLENTRQAAAIMEQLAAAEPNDREFQEQLGYAYDRVSEVLSSLTDNYSEALEYSLKSQKITEKLLAGDPQNPKLRHGTAVSHFDIATLAKKMGDYKTAMENAEKGLAIYKQLAAEDPKSEEYKQLQGSLQILVCELMIDTGRASEAVELLRHPLADLQKVLETSPNDEVARFHIAVIHNDLGKGYAALKNRNEACVNYKKSWEIGKVFMESGALNGDDAVEAEKLRAEAEKCGTGK